MECTLHDLLTKIVTWLTIFGMLPRDSIRFNLVFRTVVKIKKRCKPHQYYGILHPASCILITGTAIAL
jgi:hypothetical protein